jgi:ubiquinol-cytochrome c reductase iron-sulfur subunit
MADRSVAMAFTAPIDDARRFWIAAASVADGAGLVASAVPFVASMAPSDRACARALGAGRSGRSRPAGHAAW